MQCSLCICCSKSKCIGVVLTRTSQQVLCSSPQWRENISFYLCRRIEGRVKEKERVLIMLKGLKDVLQEPAFLGFSLRPHLCLSSWSFLASQLIVNLKLAVTSLVGSLPGYSHVHGTTPEPRSHGDLAFIHRYFGHGSHDQRPGWFSYSSSV